MPKTLEELQDELKELKGEIRKAKKIDIKLSASWTSKLISLNEQLCDRLSLMEEELDSLEGVVEALESGKAPKKEAAKEEKEEAEPEKPEEKKKGFWASLFGSK